MSTPYKTALACVLIFAASISGYSQTGPLIAWQKCYGGSGNERAYSMIAGPANGFIVAGSSTSNDGDVTGHHGATGVTDAWLVALRYDGQLLWQKSYGGSGADEFDRIIATKDGGYLAIGTTASTDGDVVGSHDGGNGNVDIWVVKLDGSGNLQWQKCLGGTSQEFPANVLQMSDSGYILIGSTASVDGDVVGNHGNYDGWLVRLDKAGNLLWQQCIGNAYNDHANDIQAIAGGGYIIPMASDGGGGGSYGSVSGGSSPNAFFVKTDSGGNVLNVLWNGPYSGNYGVLPVNNDAYYTLTISNGQICLLNANNRISIGQIDTTLASVVNQPTGTSLSYCYPYSPAVNAGYTISGSGGMGLLSNGSGVVAGYTDDSARRLNPHGYLDGFLANIGPNSWTREYGGSKMDYFSAVAVQDNFTYIAAGYTNSNDGDVSGNHGGYDFWVVKFSNFNEVKGAVYLDYNSNGVRDSNEPLVNDILVQSVKGSSTSGSLTSNGIFNNIVDTGTYSTSVLSTIPYYTVAPASHVSTFSSYNNIDSTSFGFQPIPGKRDYEISMFTIGLPRAHDSMTYTMYYVNLGTDTLQNRSVQFVYDPRVFVLSSSVAPTSVSGDTMRWTIASLAPRDTGYISVSVRLNTPPVLNLLDTLIATAYIDSAGDLNPTNNFFALKNVVLAAFDPNGKTESNEGHITTQDVAAGKSLQYTIHFQNTGNDTAFTVTVQDVLSHKLDMTSFEMVAASAPYVLTTHGDTLTWTFQGIKLPDSTVNLAGSQGYVVYRIKPSGVLAAGDSVNNTAAIFFDYNLPVATNTQATYVLGLATMPPAPQISGLKAGYCGNAGPQQVTISNMPGSGSGIAVRGTLDGQAVTVSAGGVINFQPQVMTVGAHTLAVIFTNPAGADTTTAGFQIDSPVTPVVKLLASPSGVSGSSQAVVLTATDVSGGGAQPLYIFARDAAFANIVQAESAVNSTSIGGSTLSPGNNVFYVRMRTSDTCYMSQTGIDSVVVYDTVVTAPVAPQIAGVAAAYCQNAGSQHVNVTNMPGSGSGITVTGDLDGQAFTVSAAGAITLQPQAMTVGAHTLAVIFTNSAGADTTKAVFQIVQAVTPTVKLTANPSLLTATTTKVELIATEVSGGGAQPLFTFAFDAGFVHIVQAPGASDSVSIPVSALANGANVLYVRMQTSDTCYTAATGIDSVVLTLTKDSSGGPGGVTALTIGPNPFSGEVTIGGLQANLTYGISLLSTSGQEVIKMVVQGQTQAVLRAGTLQRGVYYLRIVDVNSGRVIMIMKLLSATR